MAKRTSASPGRASAPRPSSRTSKRSPARPTVRDAKPRAKRSKAASAGTSLALRGGRTLRVLSAGDTGRETIELKSPDGALELKITMTPDGPMIHVKGASLAVEAADAVSVACKRFEVHAIGGIQFTGKDVDVRSEGEVRIRSQGPTHMDSEVLHLNCGDRSGYPPPELVMPEEMRAMASAPLKDANDGCGCGEHHH